MDLSSVPNFQAGQHLTVSLLTQQEMELGVLFLLCMMVISVFYMLLHLKSSSWISFLQLTQDLECEQMHRCSRCLQLPRCGVVQD